MKLIKLFSVLLIVLFVTSCASVSVSTDYDKQAPFDSYKTFAFYKPEIDKAKISDLDKKRILRAIETELFSLGFKKSNNPDMLVGIFTKSREKVNVDVRQNDIGFGWRWNPYWGRMNGNNVNVRNYTEGTLFIDFIDKEKKELVWQGIGTGALKLNNREKKEERIKEFVKEIISRFPPGKKK